MNASYSLREAKSGFPVTVLPPVFAAAIFFLVAIPPAIGMALAAIPTLKYALSDKEHTRILDELVARRAKNAENTNEE